MHNYSNQKLTRNNFQHQYLVGANFSNADIYGVNFSGANLTDANFTNAKIAYTNFSGTRLANANFTSANMSSDSSTSLLLVLFGSFVGCLFLLVFIAFGLFTPANVSTGNFWQSAILIIAFFLFSIVLATAIVIEPNFFPVAIAFFFLSFGTIIIPQLVFLSIIWIGSLAIAGSIQKIVIGALVGSTFGTVIGEIFITLTFSKYKLQTPELINIWREKAWLITVITILFYLTILALGYYLGLSVIKSNKSSCLLKNIFWLLPKGNNFFGTNLTNTNFTGANLKSVNFENAQINRTCFSQTKNILLAKFDKKVFNQLRAKIRDNNSSLILEVIDESGKD